MKIISFIVKIEVPDDYVIDEPEWTLENAITGDSDENIISVNNIS